MNCGVSAEWVATCPFSANLEPALNARFTTCGTAARKLRLARECVAFTAPQDRCRAIGALVPSLQLFCFTMHRYNAKGLAPRPVRIRTRREVRTGLERCVLISALLTSLIVSLPSAAEPLNLFDSSAREITVLFEQSSREEPAKLKSRFSQGFKAFVEPGLRSSELRVVIPAATVEAHLLGQQHPIPESFSDFVWTFDVETGHVVSASLNGRVTPRINWGFIKTSTKAEIRIEMGTARVGGFKRPLNILGQLIFTYCTPEEEQRDCQLVEAAPYDPITGYVNAIGNVWVRSAIMDVWNFSPMGEAVFLEADPTGIALAAGQFELESTLAEELPVASSVPANAAANLPVAESIVGSAGGE